MILMTTSRPAYLVGNFAVIDPALMADYAASAAALVRRHGGELLLSDPALLPEEGSAQPTLVLIRFPDLEAARAFYHAPDYQPLKVLRLQATQGGFLALTQGLPDQARERFPIFTVLNAASPCIKDKRT
jgi:uncharacterized protein (DUF1330 family)